MVAASVVAGAGARDERAPARAGFGVGSDGCCFITGMSVFVSVGRVVSGVGAPVADGGLSTCVSSTTTSAGAGNGRATGIGGTKPLRRARREK